MEAPETIPELLQQADDLDSATLQMQESALEEAYHTKSLTPLHRVFPKHRLEELLFTLKSVAYESELAQRDGIRHPPIHTLCLATTRMRALVSRLCNCIGGEDPPYESVFDVLVAWGLLSPHENIACETNGLHHDADAFHTSESYRTFEESLKSSPPTDLDLNRRTDYTSLPAFAIDSSDTTEIDDALSWDQTSQRILVHIADPTRYFPDGPSNHILADALDRVSSVYLPDRKLMMFSKNLAEHVFSLGGKHSEACALTFSFSVDEDGALFSPRIEPSFVSAPVRYTYEQAEALLSQASEGPHAATLQKLLQLAKKCRAWRTKKGAVMADCPQARIKVDDLDSDTPSIQVKTVRTNTKSWTLVSELMIAASAIAADKAAQSEIPAPFRGQMPFDKLPDDKIAHIQDDAVRAQVIFAKATPSYSYFEPVRHFSLGLDRYLQVTSPIRRASDLVAHFQIKAFLRNEVASNAGTTNSTPGQLPFSWQEVRNLLDKQRWWFKSLRQVEKRTNKYWQIEYLRRLGPEVEHRAVCLKETSRDDDWPGLVPCLVHLQDFGFSIGASVPSRSSPGSLLRLKVYAADPRKGKIDARASLQE